MSQKDFYDEDEIIDSLVDDVPSTSEDFRNHSDRPQNLYVKQVGCGCFDWRKLLLNLLIYSAVLMATNGIFPNLFILSGPAAAIRAAVILTLLNTFIKPILIIFTLPLTVMSMGLFYFVINGIILLMTSQMMGDSFVINNLLSAVFAALFISLMQHLIKTYVFKGHQF